MDVKTLREALPILAKAGITPNIIGRHGIGKSQIVRQVFEELGYNVIDIRLGQMADAGDLIGLPEFDRDEDLKAIATRFITPDRFPRKGEKAVIFLDEVNRANKDITQAIFEIILDFSMGGYELDRDIDEVTGMPMQFVVAGCNPPTDEYSTLDFDDAAFQDRFCNIKFEPSVEDWLSYARKKEIEPSLVGFISDQSNMLESEGEDFNLSFVKPSRRSYFAADRVIKLNPTESTLTELLYGILGTEATVAYNSFKANFADSLKGEDVLKDFKKVEELVKKLVSPEYDRRDVLNNTGDEIIDIIKKKGKLTKVMRKNLLAFLTTITPEMSTALVKKLVHDEGISNIINNDAEFVNDDSLCKHIANGNSGGVQKGLEEKMQEAKK